MKKGNQKRRRNCKLIFRKEVGRCAANDLILARFPRSLLYCEVWVGQVEALVGVLVYLMTGYLVKRERER